MTTLTCSVRGCEFKTSSNPADLEAGWLVHYLRAHRALLNTSLTYINADLFCLYQGCAFNTGENCFGQSWKLLKQHLVMHDPIPNSEEQKVLNGPTEAMASVKISYCRADNCNYKVMYLISEFRDALSEMSRHRNRHKSWEMESKYTNESELDPAISPFKEPPCSLLPVESITSLQDDSMIEPEETPRDTTKEASAEQVSTSVLPSLPANEYSNSIRTDISHKATISISGLQVHPTESIQILQNNSPITPVLKETPTDPPL